MFNSIVALYKVIVDKSYDYFVNNQETSTNQRVDNSINYYNQFKTFFSEPTYVIDNIYIGSAYNAASYNTLKKFNIHTILNITNEISEYYPDDFLYKTYKIYDNNKDDISEYLNDAYNYINNNAEKNILIHCYMGASRSASIVIYYLIKKHNMSLDEAYKFLKDKRPTINPSKKYAESLENIDKTKE